MTMRELRHVRRAVARPEELHIAAALVVPRVELLERQLVRVPEQLLDVVLLAPLERRARLPAEGGMKPDMPSMSPTPLSAPPRG